MIAQARAAEDALRCGFTSSDFNGRVCLAVGPITLFDKSFLQSLSVDEAVWFDNFFYPVVSPMFFIETVANLWKKPREGKTAEEEVGIIAAKTPELHGGPCYFHREMCIQDLLGNHVPLNGQIPMAGMRRVERDGKEGAIAEVSPEAKAFQRWQRGQFYEVERLYARKWREQVESIDLGAVERTMKQIGVNAKNCRTVDAALRYADDAILGLSKTAGRFDAALKVLEIPEQLRLHIKQQWKRRGKPPLHIFAPYATHILRVELFFRFALGANLVASTRPSHKVDIAYLFYLPFCTLFTSADKLHRQCAPLFMRSNQEFVWGPDLKNDLTALNDHFSALPTEVREQGIFKFANRLPEESRGLIWQLFERHAPGLLKPSAVIDPLKVDAGAHKKLRDSINAWEAAPTSQAKSPMSSDRPEMMIIKRSVSRIRGSWLQIDPEVTDKG